MLYRSTGTFLEAVHPTSGSGWCHWYAVQPMRLILWTATYQMYLWSSKCTVTCFRLDLSPNPAGGA